MRERPYVQIAPQANIAQLQGQVRTPRVFVKVCISVKVKKVFSSFLLSKCETAYGNWIDLRQACAKPYHDFQIVNSCRLCFWGCFLSFGFFVARHFFT